jgi:hypothetical protein
VNDLEQAAGAPELNAAAIVATLNRHQVRYVIIGAFAAIAQQAPIPATRDIDLTPEASQENLARLSLALTELGARIRTDAVPEGLPFSHDATSLAAADVWNLICADGEFDISFHPSGFAGVLSPLNDPAYFAEVTVDPEAGTIVWPGGIDLAPEPQYEQAKAHPLLAA